MEYDISQVSRLFGMTPSGLRYYEQIGLIAPQYTQSGRRKYSIKDLSGLMFLRYMRSLGISMEETREFFHYDNERNVDETGRFMLDKVKEAQEKAEYVLRSDYAQKFYNGNQHGIKHSFRLDTIALLPVSLPPLAEQKRIVARLEEILPLCERLK